EKACRVRPQGSSRRGVILLEQGADRLGGVGGKRGDIHQRLDVGTSGRRSGNDQAAVRMADHHHRPGLGVDHPFRGGDVIGHRGQRVLNGSDRVSIALEQGNHVLPAGGIGKSAVDEDNGRLNRVGTELTEGRGSHGRPSLPGAWNVTVCAVKRLPSASTNSISTLCWPRGMPTRTMVLLWPKSAHSHGRSSTVMCRWPTRGETFRAAGPATGRMRTFSTRYGMNAMPWANGPGSGGSTISLGGGSSSMGTLVLWAKAPVAIAVSSASAWVGWFMTLSPF